MIYSPLRLLKHIDINAIISNLSNREITAPEGIGFDLSLNSLAQLTETSGSLRLDTRKTPNSEEMELTRDNCYLLKANKTYLATTNEIFNLPPFLAATFYPRSTLFRSGVIFQSSVLPPGYIGPMTFLLTNIHTMPFEIEKDARFAHVVLHQLDGELNLYDGQWQGGRTSQPNFERQK